MQPGFNIYQSILSGGWQPHLPPNREPARFSHLLQAVKPEKGCACSCFFTRLIALTGSWRLMHGKDIRQEAMRLAATCGCRGSNIFLELHADGSRDRFYNLLIGYSLLNYEQWINRLLEEYHNSALGQWYHYRLVERLRSLLDMHIPHHVFPADALLTVCRVKAAAAILMHRMATSMPLTNNGFHTWLRPREELLSALAACNLPPPLHIAIINLFDTATISQTVTSAPPGEPAANAPATNGGNSPSPAETPQLSSLLEAFPDDSVSVRHLAESLGEDKNRLQDNPDEDMERSIDSKEACRLLGIDSKTLQRLRKKNSLPFSNFGGKYFYKLKYIKKLQMERSNVIRKRPGFERPSG